MIFETHAHYDDEQFDEDREQLLAGLQEAGIETVVNVGATLEGCLSTIRLAEQYPFIYAAVGVHPDEVGTLDEEKFSWLKEKLSHEKVVAVGGIKNHMKFRKNGFSVSWRLQGRRDFR